jgi:hypothetical protein
MTTVLASGADRRYGWWLLNLIGSVHVHASHAFDRIVLYDLGLTALQRLLASSIRGVELRTVPEFVPHWRQGFAWKLWVLRHVEADRVLWLDAGTTVLAPLDEALDQIDERGYWVVSQGHPLAEIVPAEYYERYGVPRALGKRTVVAAGLIGFARPSRFFDEVIVPAYEDAVRGLTLGFSAAEVADRNFGLSYEPRPVLRDCARFRADQTVLNLRFHATYDDPVVNELERWAGTSPTAHARQVIWAHRQRGEPRYLARVPYSMPTALAAVPLSAAVRLRRWLWMSRWAYRPSTYLGKVRRLLSRDPA